MAYALWTSDSGWMMDRWWPDAFSVMELGRSEFSVRSDWERLGEKKLRNLTKWAGYWVTGDVPALTSAVARRPAPAAAARPHNTTRDTMGCRPAVFAKGRTTRIREKPQTLRRIRCLAAEDRNFLYLFALYGPSAWWSADHPDHPLAPPVNRTTINLRFTRVFSQSRKRFVRLCIKVDKKLNTTCLRAP